MASAKIMIVDDEEEILEMIRLFLEREDFDVLCLQDGNRIEEAIKEHQPDLLILDVLLDGVDGVELCRRLRTFTDIPILLISCKSEDFDKVIGLSVGGDDYITKPFSPMELVARVKAHLRRNQILSKSRESSSKVMKFDDLEIDLHMQTVSINGESLALSAIEFKVLTQLARHPGRIFHMDELFELVWGPYNSSDTRTIMVHISNLRKKLGDSPSEHSYIQTIRGAGYRFNEKCRKKDIVKR
ncbi:MAG TPA: response regulator transcription factor [Bacillales bacterium]|nr:response regulator transcription factor [Bacillales bacterium]